MTPAGRRSRARRPPPVRPGDVVGVAALSSAPSPEAIEAGLRQLADLGFRVRPASNLFAVWEGFAGRDEERVAGFHRLVADPEVKAVMFARGGHGLLRILPAIDWDLLAGSPKAYVGYSDVVPLLMQVATRLRLVSFHGPMVATELASPLEAVERDSLLDALAGRLGRSLPCDCAEDAAPVVGPVLGGCLALLVATLGTAWMPRLDGALLFLEDVNEPLYRVDRMLTQLELSGRVRRVKGMILGHLHDALEVGGKLGSGVGAGDGEVAGGALAPSSWGDGEQVPRQLVARSTRGEMRRIMAWNLPCGHGRPNLTLPLGATARLDPQARALVVLDDAPGARP